jgi:hypothetical protein
MKRFTIRVKILAALCTGLLLMACKTEVDDFYLRIENASSFRISNVSWEGNVIKNRNGNLTFGSKNASYSDKTGDATVQSGSGYLSFTREGTVVMNLRTKEKITVSNDTTFTLTDAAMVVDTADESNTGSLSAIAPADNTILTVKNQSFSDLLEVQWLGVSFASNVVEKTLSIGNTVTKTVSPGSGYIYFKRKSNPVSARTKEVITVAKDETIEFTFTDNTLIVEAANPDNTGTLKDMKPTELTIKNQSFSDLLEVQWQGVTFASNAVENAVLAGNTVTKTVNPGSGYIYFKRKLTPVFARTQEVVTVTGGTEFTFTDATLIVEVNNPANTGTLKDMPVTVVFFDDAEGELQGYAERKGSAYYAVSGDLPVYSTNSNRNYFHPPYTGTGKSMALGGYDDAKLRLSFTLDRKAKFSFWYANKDYIAGATYYTNGGVLSIDGTEKAAWKGDYNWSQQEYILEAGSHDIIWTKDGYYQDYSYSSYSYLSLDNILVVYIE